MVGRDSSLVRSMPRAANSPRIDCRLPGRFGPLEEHQRGLVVTGRCRDRAPAGGEEPGVVLGVVLDVRGQHLEAVELGRQRVADGRGARHAVLGHLPRRLRGRVGGVRGHAGQRSLEEAAGTGRWRAGWTRRCRGRRASCPAGPAGAAAPTSRPRAGSARRRRTPGCRGRRSPCPRSSSRWPRTRRRPRRSRWPAARRPSSASARARRRRGPARSAAPAR